MTFGLFEQALSSEQEVGMARQASLDKRAAAIYDVREKLGPSLFASRNIEEFRDRVAMMKDDQSIYRIIGAHLHPSTGVVRSIVGRNSVMEKEFKAMLTAGLITAADTDDMEDRTTITDSQKEQVAKGEKADDVETNSGDGSDADGDDADDTDDDDTYKNAARLHRAAPGDPNHVYYEQSELDGTKFGDPSSAAAGLQVAGGRHRADKQQYLKNQGYQTAKEEDEDGVRRSGPPKKKADFSGDQDIQSTYSPSDADLVPEDNWDGYLNSVDQNSSKVDRNFTSNKIAWTVYTDWAQSQNLHPGKMATLDTYSSNLSDDQYFRLARMVQAWDFGHQPKTPSGQSQSKLTDVTARKRQAMPGDGADGNKVEPAMPDLFPSQDFGMVGDNDAADARNNSRAGKRDPMKAYIAWCTANGYQRLSARNVAIFAGRDPQLCMQLAYRMRRAMRTAWVRQGGDVTEENMPDFGAADPVSGPPDNWSFPGQDLPGTRPTYGSARYTLGRRQANRRTAAPDYLQKADDALTQLLNQKAEEFQQTIAPLQQALVTVQQAEQLQQAQNPLNVLPPPGTVNVMPGGDQGPAGMPAPGAQDLGAAAQALAGAGGAPPGGDPAAGGAPAGGMGDGAPPPAAADPSQGGLPPELQQLTGRKRGGSGKAQGAGRPRQASDVHTLWKKWQDSHTGRGDDSDYDEFASEYGVGSRAIQRLKRDHDQGKDPVPFARINQDKWGNRTAKNVSDLWEKFQSGQTLRGDDSDYESFAQQFGVGQRALNKLKQQHGHQMPTVASRKQAWDDSGTSDDFYAPAPGSPQAEYQPPGAAQGWKMTNATEDGYASWRHPDGYEVHGHDGPDGGSWQLYHPHGAAMGKPFNDPEKAFGVIQRHLTGENKHDYNKKDEDQIFAPAKGLGWEHRSGPSGPPYVRDQGEKGKHEASRKQAWSGWGPSVFPKTRQVTGWDWDNHLNGYKSHRPQHFACECGDAFPTPSGFHRCACGRQWNSYVIGTGGNTHEASAEQFLVREIPVRPDVIVANRQLNAAKKVQLRDPRTGQIHTLTDPGEIGEGEDAGTPTFKKPPADWARRGDGAKWQGSPIGKA